ncbi:MAG: hypothetical protein Tsb005_02060 [Gammaproteobacteria bacterium]
MSTSQDAGKTNTSKNAFIRLLPLVIIIIVFVLAIYFDLTHYLSFSYLKQQQNELARLTREHSILAPLLFMLIYILSVAVSLPGASLLTLAGGFLFGIVAGTFYVVVAATIGASLIFLAVKTALGDWLADKAGPWLRRLEHGFQQDAFNYLLFLRLIPLFPFWVVNIVPALLNMRLLPYFIATFLGIIPGSAVYVSVGNGLKQVFAQNQQPDLRIIFEPYILIPILLLAVLAIVPIVYKKFKAKAKP